MTTFSEKSFIHRMVGRTPDLDYRKTEIVALWKEREWSFFVDWERIGECRQGTIEREDGKESLVLLNTAGISHHPLKSA